VLVLARAPETERPARHLLRTQLTWAGFGSPAPGVWISTHAERVAEVERILTEAGLLEDAHIFLAAHRGGGELAAMVAQAWDLDALERQYETFTSEFDAQGAADPLVRIVELVHAWRKFPWIDPVLPPVLLPQRWTGVQAAGLFARSHTRWSADATAEWQRINGATR
jgi:phenylacetic acid degradation operon negative regulatory protein